MVNYDDFIAFQERRGIVLNNIRCSSIESWCPPPVGMVKINIDAGKLGDQGYGLGAVFRDHCGKVFFAAACPSFIQVQVVGAEILAARWALQLAVENGVQKIYLELDSQQAVTLLNQQVTPRNNLGLIIDDVKLLLSRFSFWSCNHIRRKGNKLAHYMAKLGVASTQQIIFDSIVLQELSSMANSDLIS